LIQDAFLVLYCLLFTCLRRVYTIRDDIMEAFAMS